MRNLKEKSIIIAALRAKALEHVESIKELITEGADATWSLDEETALRGTLETLDRIERGEELTDSDKVLLIREGLADHDAEPRIHDALYV